MAIEAAALEAAEIERVSAQVSALAACDVSELSTDQLLELTEAAATVDRFAGAIGAAMSDPGV